MHMQVQVRHTLRGRQRTESSCRSLLATCWDKVLPADYGHLAQLTGAVIMLAAHEASVPAAMHYTDRGDPDLSARTVKSAEQLVVFLLDRVLVADARTSDLTPDGANKSPKLN